jgi:uncharacterized membrane protein
LLEREFRTERIVDESWMMPLKDLSRFFLAATMIAIGLIALVSGTFAPIWQPVPEVVPGRLLLTYLSTFILLGCGAGLLSKRTAGSAAIVLLAYLTIWTILFKVPFIIRAPLVEVSYQSCGENLVLVAAAWALYVWFGKGVLAGSAALRIAHLLYGLALIAFGLSHFFYLEMTAPLVPQWLPGHVFWAYLTGGIYLTSGLAIAVGFAAPSAALVAAVQITLITLLVWGPILFAGPMTAEHWQETIVSWALTAAAWVVAASFDRVPALAGLTGLRPGTGARPFPSRSHP